MKLVEKKCVHCGLIADTKPCKYAEGCELVKIPCELCVNCQIQVDLGKVECPPKYRSGWG